MIPIEDAKLPFLNTAVTRKDMRELISDRVLPTLYPGRTIEKLNLQYARYKAGKEYLALYRLDLSPPEVVPPLVTALFAPRHSSVALYATQADQGRPSFYIENLSLRLEVFPQDTRLPELWQAADERRAASLISDAMPDAHISRIDLLRYRPGRRCVLRYSLDTPRGPATLVAKLYSTNERALATAAKLAALAKLSHVHLKFPRLVGGPPQDGLLLMEYLPGTNLGDQLEASASIDNNIQTVRRAGTALAELHSTHQDFGQHRSIDAELLGLRARLARIKRVAPDLAGSIADTLEHIERALSLRSKHPSCLIHGEYKPNQLLVTVEDLAIVDLDRAGPGDPALDLGNFMAVIRKEIVYEGHSHLDGLDDEFLAAYRETGASPSILESARLYQRIALLRMLVRYFERNPNHYARERDGWSPLVLLEEARRD